MIDLKIMQQDIIKITETLNQLSSKQIVDKVVLTTAIHALADTDDKRRFMIESLNIMKDEFNSPQYMSLKTELIKRVDHYIEDLEKLQSSNRI